MKKKKEFKIPNRKQPFWKFIKKIMSIFIRKPKIINLAGEIEDKALYTSNHHAKQGPFYMDMFFPKFHCMWGAHEMLGNYKSRFLYLRDVFYIQKRGFNKFFASFLASFEAIFSIFMYKGMHVIPTYQDYRMKETIKNSITLLDNDIGIIIFPEDSSNGYFEELKSLKDGCLVLSKFYYKKTQIDIPVYPIYFSSKKRLMIIDKPIYVNELLNSGKTLHEVNEILRLKINNLYIKYIKKK